ncbi:MULTISPECIES: response regulator [Stenotrophomonas]|uniref:response regulator n=1 Tax=Stenotrophomonas TaxID=40323 RepID=UPI001AA0F0FB|nr:MULTISPECIES: response regulator [Stenotrophomonas]ELF4106906.1 response regulator transcription factor [Stenotrophomonas maltophilia]MBO1743935.1 response regulator transcription factor [Stenotrophomonas maltophilia]MCU1176227.1 response regulator transcription factor [Stenotrophomonas maltophilia]WAP00174.1 response regulator [Stenotrophomonas sp. SBJS02]HEA4091185.1 response regulator transcription factor [Stenotrophomonas maltophilia]
MKPDTRMRQAPLVLIAEDEGEIADILGAYLARSGLRSVRAVDGEAALASHRQLRPDLVLLDVQMPRMDGWQVLSELRRRGNTPVIMLTALDQDVDKLTGLRVGADDYVAKPFNPAEIVARIQAVLRRSAREPSDAPSGVIRQGPFEIDLRSHEVTVRTDEQLHALTFTLTEFRLLVHMARAPRQVHSRLDLLHNCLPEGDAQERTVDSHVSKLRRKLEDVGVIGIPATIRGVGYRFLD